MAGIYLHIPFCHKACSYCNFHFSTSLKQKDELVSAMLVELEQRREFFDDQEDLTSVYFGGGTPSILSESDLDRIFNVISKYYSVATDAEITLEANPEDITITRLQSWRKQGVNRLSVGLQSFHEQELRFMNRNHNAAQSHQILELIPDNGFDNYSIDLIFGVPNSTEQLWQQNLDIIAGYHVPHLSCYGLTVEEKTKLHHDIQKGKYQELDSVIAAKQFVQTHEYLLDLGYQHYEISNYAKPGQEAIHNSSYWSFEPYLGIGPSAHSFDGKQRLWNIANNGIYIKNIKDSQSYTELEKITDQDRYNEFIMFGFRTQKGISQAEVSAFGRSFLFDFQAKLREVNTDYLTHHEDKYRLSLAGMLQADSVIADFFFG